MARIWDTTGDNLRIEYILGAAVVEVFKTSCIDGDADVVCNYVCWYWCRHV